MISELHRKIGFGIGCNAFVVGFCVVGFRPDPPTSPMSKNSPVAFSTVTDPPGFGLLLPEGRGARAEDRHDGLSAG